MAISARTYFIIGPLVVIVVLLSVALLLPARPAHPQPLAFNHKAHIEAVGLNCKDCHLGVETMAVASIPRLEVCQNCHTGEPISQSPVEKELLQYIAEKKEIPWNQVYSVPDHVYFSHRRHVMVGEMECTVCHGNVAAMSTPVTEPIMPVTMEYCMNCHKQHKITNDCIACHR